MNRWLEAIWFDLTHQEHKQRLTREEKMNYSLYMGVFFAILALLSVLIPDTLFAVIAMLVFTGIALRKIFIYHNKREQWDKENKDYNADV